MTNSTISGNQGNPFGGGGGLYNSGTATLLHVTIAFNASITVLNQPPEGGGIVNSGTLTLRSTLLSRNSQDCSGTINSQGNTLVCNATSCTMLAAINDQIGTTSRPISAQVLALAANGGPTLTHALRYLSPAIDNADPNACPATDQRGVTRPQDGDGNGRLGCDIGAFEREPTQTLGQHGFFPLLDR